MPGSQFAEVYRGSSTTHNQVGVLAGCVHEYCQSAGDFTAATNEL